MRYFITTILSLFLLLTSQAYAGSGHDHGHSHAPVSKEEAENLATESVARLVERNKVDRSWQSVAAHKSEKKEFGGRMEWVVTFKNEKISDPEKQTIYVFLSLEGQYIAANHTGD